MISYIESNFVLELALGQEESAAAHAILGLAESGRMELAIPVVSISEPFSTLAQAGRERQRLSSMLREQLRQVGRSTPHQEAMNALRPIPSVLQELEQRELELLKATVLRVLRTCRILPISATIYLMALNYQERVGLQPIDSMIYASIIQDMTTRDMDERKVFMSRNSNDFRKPPILSDLLRYHCSYFDKFQDGLQFALNL